MIDFTHYWWPVARSSELRPSSPLARRLLDRPLVLIRDSGGQPAALLDRCPHRQAPLSQGRVQAGELQCPYHGWRFDSRGQCTAVPGMHHQPTEKPLLDTFSTCTAHGLIWVCLALRESTPPPVAPAQEEGVDEFVMVDTVRCTIAQAAENFLDGFHTHYVHSGWIRNDRQRQSVRATTHCLPSGIEARYHEEGRQSGLISRIFEPDRESSAGRFLLPGVAEIEYRGKRGLTLLVTAWMTPEDDHTIRIHARIATRAGILPGWFKQLVASRLFGVILRQDKEILEQTSSNIDRFGQAGLTTDQLNSPLDLLGPAIEKLLTGEPLDDSIERQATFQL